MRAFYLRWFFVCSGWGYLLATGLDMTSPSVGHALVTLPVLFATGLGFLAFEFWRLPKGGHLTQPSLALKPWNNYPVGLLVFISATFVLGSVWGVGLSVTVPLPGLPASLQFLALGGGMLAALLLAPRLLPGMFARSGPSVGQEQLASLLHSVWPNPSLKAPTRYGSHRLAATGLSEYHPCAASRRLPPRSA